MKRFSALLLAILMCLCFVSCKDDSATQTPQNNSLSECTERQIQELVEKNLDCYFLYYVSPLSHTTQQNSDGYYGTDGSFFNSYSELEALVKGTYTSQRAEMLLAHPSKETPLYKNVQDEIFVKPDVIEPVQYDIIWDDTYTIEITENGPEKCSFKLSTTDLDGKEYTTNGECVFENGSWLLTNIIY